MNCQSVGGGYATRAGELEEQLGISDGTIALSEHCEYRVLRSSLFKKPSRNPASGKVVKVKGSVGSTVLTTGRSWTGPRGGKWVELDSLVEVTGWLLVEGPGFGISGPMLRKVTADDGEMLVLCAGSPTRHSKDDLKDFVVDLDSKVSEVKIWLSLLFGLDPRQLIVAASTESLRSGKADYNMGVETYFLGSDQLLEDKMTVRQAGWQHGDEVQYIYMGCHEEIGEGKELTWLRQKAESLNASISQGRPARAKTVRDVLSAWPDLQAAFDVLGLRDEAEVDDIKRCFRKLALQHHPDKHPDDAEAATLKFQGIRAAFELIQKKLQL